MLIGTAVLVFFVSEAWLLWLVLLFLFGRVYAAPLDMITPLDARRQTIAILGLVVFLVTFVPIPFSFVDVEPLSGARDNVMLVLPIAIALLTLWTRRKR
jgi:hypothetical protein